MAEYGKHHATSGESRPSIFEVIGQENLVFGLRAAFKHIFKVLGENYPHKFGLLYANFDEGYTAIDSVFQYIHLRLKGGLFTETFYGLKRAPDPRSLDTSKKKIILWVFLSVVAPYVHSQLEDVYKKVLEKKSSGTLNYKDIRQQLSLLLLKTYPTYHFVHEMVGLIYYMAYGIGVTDYHSFSLYLTSTKLVPLTLLDGDGDAWTTFIPQNDEKKLSTTMWKLINVFVNGFTLTVSVGAFLTQFLDWWYNQEGNPSKLTSLPAPPPPPQWHHDFPPDICPICKRKRTNDTALSSSGFVFCYPCVFRFVQQTNKCPVTGYRSTLSQLIKLYDQE